MSETTANTGDTAENATGEGTDLLAAIAGEAAAEVAKATGNPSKAEKEARRATKRAKKEATEKATREAKEATEKEATEKATGETPKTPANTSTTVTLPSSASREKVTPTVKVYPIGVVLTLAGNVYRVRILSRNTGDGTSRVVVGTGEDCTIPANPTAERVSTRDIIAGEKITVAEGLATFTADHNAWCDSLTAHPVIDPTATSWECFVVNAAVTGEKDDVIPFGAGECVRGTFTRTTDGWSFTRDGETSPAVIPGGTNRGAVATFSPDVAGWETTAMVFRAVPPVTVPRVRAMFIESMEAFSAMVGVMARAGGAGAVTDTLRGIIDTLRAYPPVIGA